MGAIATKQVKRPMTIRTPLGADALLLVGLTGHEGLSQLFSFQLDLRAENGRKVPFEKLLGQKVTVELQLPAGPDAEETERYFNGICSRVSQGESSKRSTDYKMELVPRLWLLTKRSQSRIFQHLAVPDILKKVLDWKGLRVEYQLDESQYKPRDFCVQYRESDFNFASRLMEEEGLWYFFQHTKDEHVLVVADRPGSHLEMPFQSEVLYENIEGGVRFEDRIYDWEKVQELRSSKVRLWDQCFELTGNAERGTGSFQHLEAVGEIRPSVPVGEVTHELGLEIAKDLEIYDYPGEYAQRFDGIDRSGNSSSDTDHIAADAQRTADIRIQEEALPGLIVQGSSNCRQFVSGYWFTLKTLPADALAKLLKAEGKYVLASLEHIARLPESHGAGANGRGEFAYTNSFTCLPFDVPFRPLRTTPKPVVQGTHTAVVVGSGADQEEIFTDKYGRVKVQFHWDRKGRHNAWEDQGKYKDSSCWVRVATPWAGKQWGMVHIPRIGQEVIVDFLEGDPDQPIILGSVYNAEQMPPYELPTNPTQSGMKSRSTPEGEAENFNELRFEDKKDEEHIYFHAEKDFNRVVENNDTLKVGFEKKDKGDQTIAIFNNQSLTVGCADAEEGNQKITVFNNQELTVGCSDAAEGSQTITVWKDRTETVKEGNETVTIEKGDRTVAVSKGMDTLTVKKDHTVTVEEGNEVLEVSQGDRTVTIGQGKDTHQIKQGDRVVKIDMGKDELKISMGDQKTKVDLGKIETEAMQSIEIKVGQSSIKLEQSGVTIKGMQVKIEGQIQAEMKGAMTTVKGDGMLTLKGGLTMIN